MGRNAAARGGAVCEGQALLQGLLRCGRRMHLAHSGARGPRRWAPRYHCDPHEHGVDHNRPDGPWRLWLHVHRQVSHVELDDSNGGKECSPQIAHVYVAEAP